MTQPLGFGARLGLALKIIFDGVFAARLATLTDPNPQLPPGMDDRSETPPPDAQEPPASDPSLGQMHMLAILQREGRLIDFLMEEVSGFSDADVGGAARVIHEGCCKALRQYLELVPLREEEEGALLTIEPGYDPAQIRLTGAVTGEPPFRGTLAHAGWRAKKINLPTPPERFDRYILAPAELELS